MNRSSGLAVRRTTLTGILLMGALSTKCEMRFDCGGWYRDMSVDAHTATVTLIERLQSGPGPLQPSFREEISLAGHSISELGPERAERGRPRLNYFLTDPEHRLIYRSKQHELLRGAFGSVYAESAYYYADQYRGQPTHFSVQGYAKMLDSQTPTEIEELPDVARDRLEAVSLVRIVRAYPELAVFSATYSPDGKLRWLWVNPARNGDYASAHEFVGGDPPINGGGFREGTDRIQPWYGIPPTFPVEQYVRRPTASWPTAQLPEELTVVNLHYARNQWVRQDHYRDGVQTSSRILHFPPTSRDKMLASVDQNRGFGHWTEARWE